MKALFHDLRKARPDQVDSFWDTMVFEVIATKSATNGILLNKQVPPHLQGQWFFQGKPLVTQGHIDELLVLESPHEISPGDLVEFHVHTSSTTAEVHQQLAEFWKPRWNSQIDLTDETWQRVSRFIEAHMPKLPLQLPPLTVENWVGALRRFRPAAARGADGWARLDLLNMPRALMQRMLSILSAVENGSQPWPQQLLEGLVIAIAKCGDAHRPNEYRPIVLLSIVYRCWASLRARQMLHQLEPYIHADAHGFLPTREPAQTWLHVQAAVETSIQSSLPLAGIGTDFVKAFTVTAFDVNLCGHWQKQLAFRRPYCIHGAHMWPSLHADFKSAIKLEMHISRLKGLQKVVHSVYLPWLWLIGASKSTSTTTLLK